MRWPLLSLAPVALLGLALLLPAPAAGGAKTSKTSKKSRSARPTPTLTPRPTPTPARYLRAAGSCMEFTPGQHVVVAEVGSTGRVFRVDGETRIETEVKKGVRLRILYVDTPEGPVARRILPGPVAPPKPTPRRTDATGPPRGRARARLRRRTAGTSARGRPGTRTR